MRSPPHNPTAKPGWTARSPAYDTTSTRCWPATPHDPNRKLLKHLANEREHLLTFLTAPGVAATNWRAEQAIRPTVVNRKNWGGNRTRHGADIQQTLMSVIRTSRQQRVCPIALLEDLQHHRTPATSSMLRLPPTSIGPRGP